MREKRGARLGQHFLTARSAARALVRAAAIAPREQVLEIGPGTGFLTRELLSTGGSVTAIEKDGALIERLRKTFPDAIEAGHLRIIASDIRDVGPEELGLRDRGYVVAANIPYYITGEILRRFLSARAQPRAMALLVQKEVAQRIVAQKESILSVSVKSYGSPRIIEKVSRRSFSPAPSVDSAVLLIDNISRMFFDDVGEKEFFDIVHAGFSSKRKLLANNLGAKFGKRPAVDAIRTCGLDENVRAEDVRVAKWKELAKILI